MSTLLGKRDRNDDEDNEDEDLNIEAPPSKKRRTDEKNNRKESDRSDKNESNELSPLPIAAVNKVITLNVGGIKYTTTLNTLTGYESMLKTRFSGNYSMEPMDDGSYFFDRDGDLFRYILKYLRSGEVRIPEKWTKTELCSFHDEVEYFAVTSLLNKLALKFFDSKILTHDAMKQKLINAIIVKAKDSIYAFEREILPTKEWVLQFEYNRTTETQREYKKTELKNVICEGQLPFMLVLAAGQIYGRLMPNHLAFKGDSWLHWTGDMILTFRWPSYQHLRNPHDPEAELKIDYNFSTNMNMTTEEKENHKSPLHWFWILSKHPYAIEATVERCYNGDFIIKSIGEHPPSRRGKLVQRIEIWNIPSHTVKTLNAV